MMKTGRFVAPGRAPRAAALPASGAGASAQTVLAAQQVEYVRPRGLASTGWW